MGDALGEDLVSLANSLALELTAVGEYDKAAGLYYTIGLQKFLKSIMVMAIMLSR
ncbi:MAG: hypothetical protein AABW49_00230 [Nanoarchaeota archaeon]